MPSPLPIPHPLRTPLNPLIAERFRCLGGPMRIALLDRLRDGQASVAELQETTGASQPKFSKHSGALLRAGQVSRTKRGTSSGYAIADGGALELCEQYAVGCATRSQSSTSSPKVRRTR